VEPSPDDPYIRCAEDIPPGWYLVLVVDVNHCYVLLWVHIPTVNPLEANFEITSEACDDQVDGCLTVSGGTQPYKVFAWRFPAILPVDPVVDFPTDNAPTVNDLPPTNDIPFGVEPSPDGPYVRCAEDIPPGWYLVLVVDVNHCYVLLWVHIQPPDPLEAEFNITSNQCDEQVDGCLFIDGGTEPYKVFVWRFPEPLPTDPTVDFPASGDPTVDGQPATNDIQFESDSTIPNPLCAENIPPGWYLVLVVDANHCYVLLWIHIPVPNPLKVNGEVTDVSCFGLGDGKIELTISGGTPPYTIVFSSDGNSNSSSVNSLTVIFDNLSAGEYTIMVFDANQCSLTRSFVVGQPDELLVNLSFDPQGTFACAEPSGGTPPYSFAWFDLNSNEVISNEDCVYDLEPGAYFIIVKDAHDCEANELFIIAPSPCEGGEAVVDPAIIESGESSTFFLFNWAGSGLQWQFKTIFTGWIDIPGATAEVFETPPINTSVNKAILIRAAVFCENGTIEYSNTAVLTIIGNNFSGNSNPEKEDARLFDAEQQEEVFQKEPAGKFYRGLETTVYPTVSSGEVNVRFDFQTTTRTHVTVSNWFGKIILKKELDGVQSGDQLNLHLSNLPSGNYLISVENEGRIDTKRIFIGR
jgi:SprB repeat/Secretion system C-terminal sorting domain